jgi:hypothetical protein
MRSTPRKWAQGTGQWQRYRTLIMSQENHEVAEDALVVGTPLELIIRLENEHESIGSVVLSRAFAGLATALRELYPRIPVVEEAA